MHKTKIAIVLPNLGIGGAETQLISIANQLGDQYEFHFVLFSKHFPLLSRLKNPRVHAFASPLSGLFGLVFLLRKLKCRIVLSSIIDINLLILAIRPALPTNTKIIVREALDPLSAIELTRFPKVCGWLYRRLYPKADRIVSLSVAMSDNISKLVGPGCKEKIHVISNGVSQEKIFPVQSTFRKQNIIAVGRLDRQKGYDNLIRGFGRYLNQPGNKEFTLTIYGEGPLRDKLENLVRSLGLTQHVLLPGVNDAVIQDMQSSAFLVVSSRFEGLSNVMLEALVNGVPVLSTIEKTSAEEVIHSSNGLLKESSNPKSIADGIASMVDNVNQFDRQKIAADARDLYSIASVASGYAKLFDDLIN